MPARSLSLMWASGALILLCGCERARPLIAHAPQTVGAPATEAFARYECNRCHTITGIAAPPIKTHCTGCHAQILDGTYPEQPEMHATWRAHITHLLSVPSLSTTSPRFERAWLIDYLREPHDLRPRLGEQMPRLAMTPPDIELLANALASPPPAEGVFTIAQLNGDVARGKLLVNSMGCGSCHVMSGADLAPSAIPVELPPTPLAAAMKFAPDLAATRGRMAPDVLAMWLRDPSQIKPDALMPKLPMSEQDARDMASYLLTAKLEAVTPPHIPARLPVLERRVIYEEVEQRVFKKVCWHCHSEGDYVGGDGGPGNTGGFGFKGRGLGLAEYSAIASGMLDAKGKRMSVFTRREDGTPWIVAAMHARYAEIAGEPLDDIRGMPLGLPPMTLEEIQLVETWIVQGRPRE